MDENCLDWNVRLLVRTAERLDSLADTAELMGDSDGAAQFRAAAASRRLQAMTLLDDRPQ